MLTYVLRRILLMPPTLIGMTAIVFFVLATAPGGIGASLLSKTGEMKPEERKAREDYLNRRYGLNKPKSAQYIRWLNKVTPIGFRNWEESDQPVIEAAAKEKALQKPFVEQIEQLRAERAKLSYSKDEAEINRISDKMLTIERQQKAIDVSPDAGDIRWSRPAVKVPELGESFVRSRKVSALIAEALPKTLLLQAMSLPLGYALAVWLGIQQATRRGGAIDVTISSTTLALWALPTIWVAVLLIGTLANDQIIHLFPTTGLNDITETSMAFLPSHGPNGFEPGWLLDRLYHCILPVVCLTYGTFAILSRLARGALLDNLGADFVRTARAKGLHERVVLYRHAFRNSLIPLITVAGQLLPAMVTGAVVIETIFGINGMGKLAFDAAQQRDFELLLSITLVTAVLELIAYLLTDLGYAIADPRVSYA